MSSRFFNQYTKKMFYTNASFFVGGALTLSAYQYAKKFQDKKKKPEFVEPEKGAKRRFKTLMYKLFRIGSAPQEILIYDKPHKQFHNSVAEEFGLPSQKEIRAYMNGYITSVDAEKRIPNWVIESFDKAYVSTPEDKKVKRTQDMFSSDIPFIDECFKAKNEDYRGSGWSRGHLAAAGNHSCDYRTYTETFWLNSNIVPQDFQNNGGFWARLERWVKDLVKSDDFERVTVMTGPVFMAKDEPPKVVISEQPQIPQGNANATVSKAVVPAPQTTAPAQPPKPTKPAFVPKPCKIMNYKLIGDNWVAVPTHLFKVIVAEPSANKMVQQPNAPKTVGIGAYLVPNEPIPDDKKLQDFEIPLEKLEKFTGIKIFDKIQRPGALLAPIDDKNKSNQQIVTINNKKYKGVPLCEIANCNKFFTADAWRKMWGDN